MMLDIFVSPPYDVCPKCGQKFLGILSIDHNVYYKRCALCRYPGNNSILECYNLPKIKKKIIYLDQHVICNFAFIDNSKKNVPEFYKKLYKYIKNLFVKQAIVCPESQAHEEESSFHSGFELFRDYYRMFSGGIKFDRFLSIAEKQFNFIIECIINNCKAVDCSSIHYSILSENANKWTGKYEVVINRKMQGEWIAAWKEDKRKISVGLESLFVRFKSWESDPFDKQYLLELRDAAKTILQQNSGYLEKLTKYERDGIEDTNDPFWIFNYPFGHTVVRNLFKIADGYGHDPNYTSKTLLPTLLSPMALSKIPHINISALIFAGLARNYFRNKAMKPATNGDSYDIEIISHLLPYCDAMVIDNKFGILLDELNRNGKINYKTKFFYISKQDQLFSWLETIDHNIPAEQAQTAKMLYHQQH
jgi:hypothetical protein